MLMRYSALTFNAHRIHYDQGFSAEHGHGRPCGFTARFWAQGLIMLATEKMGGLRHFEFRATARLSWVNRPNCAGARTGATWVRGANGRLVMRATAS